MCVAYAVFGVGADLIVGAGKFKNIWLNILAYMLYSLAAIFPYVMFFFSRESYMSYLLAKGTDQAYLDTMAQAGQDWIFPVIVIGTLLVSFLSGLFGKKLLKKQFEKGGHYCMSGVHTDPRTKIFVLLICAVAITISPSLYYEGGLVLLIFIYGIASGKPKYSVITALVYGVLIGIAVLSNLYLTGALRLMFTTFSDFIGKMFPCGMMGGLLIGTTQG